MPKNKEDILKELKEDFNKLPPVGQTKKEDYFGLIEKLSSYYVEGTDDSADLVDLPGAEAVTDQIYSMFDSKDGVLSQEQWLRIQEFYDAIIEYSTPMKIEQRTKLNQIKDKVKNKDIPGTEYLLDDERDVKSDLATNLYITQNRELYQKIDGCEQLINTIFEKAQSTKVNKTEQTEVNGVKQTKTVKAKCSSELISLRRKKIDVLMQNYPQEIRDNSEKYLEHGMAFKNTVPYKVNKNYKEGEPMISELPEFIATIDSCTEQQLEEEYHKILDSVDNVERFEKDVKGIAENAKLMLEELDNIELPEGKKNPKEYLEMHTMLKKISTLADPIVSEDPNEQPKQRHIYHSSLKKYLNDLTTASKNYHEYYKKNSSIIHKDEEYEKKRADMSKRLMSFAELSKPVADPQKYGMNDILSSFAHKKEARSKLRKIEIARTKKGFHEFGPYTKKEITVAEKIAQVKAAGEEAKRNVKMGSAEYDKAIASLDDLSQASKLFEDIKANKDLDSNGRRELLSQVKTALENSKKRMDDYIERKRRQGKIQTGATADLKSQKRINVVNNSLKLISDMDRQIEDYYISLEQQDAQLSEDMANEIKQKNIDLDARRELEKNAVKKHFSNEEKNRNGYLKTTAKYANKGISILENILVNNEDSFLTQENVNKAIIAMGTVVYHKMLTGMPKDKIAEMETWNVKDSDYSNSINEFSKSMEFLNVIGNVDGNFIDIDKEMVKDFLSNPDRYAEKIIDNRKAVREIENRKVNRVNTYNDEINLKKPIENDPNLKF